RDSSVTGVQTCALPICMSIDRFTEAMGPYLGRHFVAKPTHGSAATEFLDARPDLTKLYRAGRYNYFYSFRESQYAPLERKIIIEENIEIGRASCRERL